ncbi:MAG: hypothetical protein ACJZ19_02545 [Candidatus Neomarinimicrobiota bacterium]|tara:strand:+ start:339 stop:1145 length:807 start_codon:yes stop_codon:yes gene_type:complete
MSCFNLYVLNKGVTINPNQWSNKKIVFSDLSRELSKQKKINTNWSRLHSDVRIPYFRLKNNTGIVLGDYFSLTEQYLVVQLDNGKKYKWNCNVSKPTTLPTHIALLEDIKDAKKYIGKNIWLNNNLSDSIFLNYSERIFKKFEKVKIVGVKIFQNSIADRPIWLEIYTFDGYSAFIRYNGEFKLQGRQNNYYDKNPFKKMWNKVIVQKIKKGKIDFGMNQRQVRLSIGNPASINNTSSRHGVSQQWIFGDSINDKRYLLFKNGKLVSM